MQLFVDNPQNVLHFHINSCFLTLHAHTNRICRHGEEESANYIDMYTYVLGFNVKIIC